jgi:hypothetical protein
MIKVMTGLEDVGKPLSPVKSPYFRLGNVQRKGHGFSKYLTNGLITSPPRRQTHRHIRFIPPPAHWSKESGSLPKKRKGKEPVQHPDQGSGEGMSFERPFGRGFPGPSSMSRMVHLVLMGVEDDLQTFVDVRLVVGVLHVTWRRVRSSPYGMDMQRERTFRETYPWDPARRRCFRGSCRRRRST